MRNRLFLSFGWLATSTVSAFAPTNFFRVNDPFFIPRHTQAGVFNLSCHAEGGNANQGRDKIRKHTNILRIYNDTESVIPMLRNPTPTIAGNGVEALLNSLRRLPGGAVTTLNRGLVEFKGSFQQIEGALHAGYTWSSDRIPGMFSLSIHQPFITKKVTSFCYNDLTPSFYCADIKVQNFVKELVGQVKMMGNLTLGNWQNSGFGDTVAQLEWRKVFENMHHNPNTPAIKSLMVYAKLGLLCPLAPRKNEDIALSMPLGHDGHWGIPGGAGMEVCFMKYIKTGLFVDFLTLLEHSRERRLKTDITQTNFLLLNKGFAIKDPGFTWQFESFVEFFESQNHLWIKFMYQMTKHYSDRLFSQSSLFDNNIINTAPNLQDWMIQNVIFSIGQDYPDHYCSPSMSIFYKLPISGERAIDNHAFGAQLQLSF